MRKRNPCLADRIPGKSIKITINQMVVSAILTGRQNTATIEKIMKEIETIGYTTSAIDDVVRAQEAGLISDKLASLALGIKPGEVEKAKKDRADRAVATLRAQTKASEEMGLKNPASRGLPELDANPQSGVDEKKEAEANV